MLPKKHRLSRQDFDLVYKKGRRIRGKSFGLIVLLSDNKNESCKIGIIVSKKVSKKASERNKLKRQIGNVLIENTANMTQLGEKIILTAFPAPKTRNFQEVKEELIELFKKNA